jgi:hypothetical protein
MLEDGRTVALDRLADEDIRMPISLHEILQAVAAIFDPERAKIESGREQVEGHDDGLSAPPRAQQPVEVTVAVRPKSHGFPVQNSVFDWQAGDTGRDPREPRSDIGGLPRPEANPRPILPGEQPPAIMLQFVKPPRAGGRRAG